MSKLGRRRIKINSIRFKVFLLVLFVGVIPVIATNLFILNSIEDREVNMKTIEITAQSKLLATQIDTAGYLDGDGSSVIDAQLKQISNIYDGRIMIVDKSYSIIKDTYDMDEGKIITSEEVVAGFDGKVTTNYNPEYGYIEMIIPITNSTNSQVNGVIIISVSADGVMSNLVYYRQQLNILTLILVVILIFGALFASGAVVKPLKRLRQDLEHQKNGIEVAEIPIRGGAETEEIAREMNGLMTNMKALDASRQEFVSNVSHELKTPITSMKVLADSLLSQENVPAELYKEFMEDIAAEIERESTIINDLLALVKMDKAANKPDIKLVNMNELLEVIMKRIQPIATKANVELVLESFRPVTAEVDEVKMSLAISNLIENAVKYNKEEGGYVHVSLNADHQYFYLTVEDSGIGIPEESIEHIFERFYRVDKSHSREIGGTGLGLAITRNSILLHRGAIKVDSELGVGTTFSIRVPLNYIT